MSQHIGLSVQSDQWFTPPEIIGLVTNVFGSIDLDVCGSEESNKIVRATQVITEDSIDKPWYAESIFCNPPSGKYRGPDLAYRGMSNPSAFFAKLNRVFESQQCSEYIYLGYSIEQLQTLQTHSSFPGGCMICLPKKRIRFVDQGGNRNNPTHGNFILYRGEYYRSFHRNFSELGVILTTALQ
jgi:hypothetical protein